MIKSNDNVLLYINQSMDNCNMSVCMHVVTL